MNTPGGDSEFDSESHQISQNISPWWLLWGHGVNKIPENRSSEQSFSKFFALMGDAAIAC